jgi:hypothetical protein
MSDTPKYLTTEPVVTSLGQVTGPIWYAAVGSMGREQKAALAKRIEELEAECQTK